MYDWHSEADAERFVREYADLILRLTLSYGLSRPDAQDICQDLFLKLLTTRQTFRDAEHEKAWIIRATGNACKNLLRSPHRRCRATLDDAQAVALPPRDIELLALIQALPMKCRAAVSLYYLEGYSTEESAALLGISPAAMRKRLERARQNLKTNLKGVLS